MWNVPGSGRELCKTAAFLKRPKVLSCSAKREFRQTVKMIWGLVSFLERENPLSTGMRLLKKGSEKRHRSSKSSMKKQTCLSSVVVMLGSRYIASRERLEGDQASFRAFLKSVSAVGEGQQLLLRGTVLTAGLSQGCRRYHRDLQEPENDTNRSWVRAGEWGSMDHLPQFERLSPDCDWAGAGGLMFCNHRGTVAGSLSLFGIPVIVLYLICTSPHADFSLSTFHPL